MRGEQHSSVPGLVRSLLHEAACSSRGSAERFWADVTVLRGVGRKAAQPPARLAATLSVAEREAARRLVAQAAQLHHAGTGGGARATLLLVRHSAGEGPRDKTALDVMAPKKNGFDIGGERRSYFMHT